MNPFAHKGMCDNERAASTANEVARSRRKTTPGLADQTFRRVIDVPSVSPTPTSVYRYYDKSSLLLYVGITSRGIRRQREHNHDKEWWPFVTKQEVEHYSTRATASAREKELIRQFRPPFNRTHNPGWDDLRALYLASADQLPRVRQSPVTGKILPARKAFQMVGGKVPLTQIQAGNEAVFVASQEFCDLFRSVPPSRERVLLRTPKKQGVLTQIDAYEDMPQLTFAGERGGIPGLRNVYLHLKVDCHAPFIARAHEAVGVKV